MKIAVPNSIIFILDTNNDDLEIPEYSGNLVSRSPSCVSIGTQADIDGETEISIDSDIDRALSCVFYGEILTPSVEIVVETSERYPIARLGALSNKTSFTVWVDDTKWPARVSIVIARA